MERPLPQRKKILLHLLACLTLACPLCAQIQSSGSVRLALIENTRIDFSDSDLTAPLMHLLQQAPSRGILRNIDMIPCYHSASDYRFRIPGGFGDGAAQTPAIILETESAVAIISPPTPDLVSDLLQAAQDCASYGTPWSVHPSSRTVTLSEVTGPAGESLVTALIDPSRGEGARWHDTLAGLVRLSWKGQDVSLIVVGKEFGGLGRLATALQREQGNGPPIIGVSRGNVFGDPLSEIKGTALTETLEKLGLSYCAVGPSELFYWKDLEDYRRNHPHGMQFLSANLVYSTAPTVSVLPDHVVVEAGGLKVAVTAITPLSAAKYLPRSGLTDARLSDPLAALRSRLPQFRAAADLVVLLTSTPDDLAQLREAAGGVDIILAESGAIRADARPVQTQALQLERRRYEPALWTMRAHPAALNMTWAAVTRRGERADMQVRGQQILLDESLPGADSFPEFDPQSYGVNFSSDQPLIPAARELLPPDAQAKGALSIQEREFWTMAAGLLAEETRSEAGILRAWPLSFHTAAAVKESGVRNWLSFDDEIVILSLSGAQLQALLAASQQPRPPQGQVPFVVGAIGPAGTTTVHGLPLEPRGSYRVATSRLLADILKLPETREPAPRGHTIADTVLAALRRRRGSTPARYWDWMQGQPVAEHGLWRINFRDVSLNLQDTQVARDDTFNSVSNPRVQGSDQFLIGGELKTDADYLFHDYKWGNTLELDYARSRLRPRDQPPITDVAANRISVTTGGTRKAGAVWAPWLARSWGPSFALNYEGQLEATPPLRRRQIYSAYPGVEFYDGTFVRSLRIAANIKRDYAIDPVDTQYGVRARALLARDIGPAPVRLDAELWANYFFLTGHDRPQDLRWESDVNFKLRVPIRQHLTVAPFVDFYSFALKTRPLWGYSAMTGISIGFSRVWKPQYERF